MKSFIALFPAALALVCLAACSHGPRQATAAPKPAPTKLHGDFETFTGKVVLVPEGYRFKPFDHEDQLLRLTRSNKSNELASGEIGIKKYYEKTLVVRGKRHEDWIWNAQVIGQWLRPGESAGPNLTAP